MRVWEVVGREAHYMYKRPKRHIYISIHVSFFYLVNIHQRLGENYGYADKNITNHSVCRIT